MRHVAGLIVTLAVPALGAGALSTSADLPSGERPVIAGQAPPSPTSYGLCNGPQNATNWPGAPGAGRVRRVRRLPTLSSDVPAAEQRPFGLCGGYSVAFGPMGEAEAHVEELYVLRADWGTTAHGVDLRDRPHRRRRLGATAARTPPGTVGDWERIGRGEIEERQLEPRTSKICYIELAIVRADRIYNTLYVAFIVMQGSGASAWWGQKRAKGTIVASKGNGQCVSASPAPAR